LKISPRRVHARRGFDSESFLRVSLSCDALHEGKAPRKDAGKGFYSIPSSWTGKEPVSMRPDKSGLARHCSVVKEPLLSRRISGKKEKLTMVCASISKRQHRKPYTVYAKRNGLSS
jgi:hypothetical protein